MTQDVNIALPQDRIDDFLRTAAVSGFDILTPNENRWPKLQHRETGIDVDILPEGGRPRMTSHPAPTKIPHPLTMGAVCGQLHYVSLSSLIELKLAAGRLRDDADVLDLALENRDRTDDIRQRLQAVHPQYLAKFDELLAQLDDSAIG